MSVERDELMRLVLAIPDDQVQVILADVRKRVPAAENPGLAYGNATVAEPSYWY